VFARNNEGEVDTVRQQPVLFAERAEEPDQRLLLAVSTDDWNPGLLLTCAPLAAVAENAVYDQSCVEGAMAWERHENNIFDKITKWF